MKILVSRRGQPVPRDVLAELLWPESEGDEGSRLRSRLSVALSTVRSVFDDTPVPPAEWIPLTDDRSVEEEHVWSPQGDGIYFVSERDGNRCVWLRKLDAATKRPGGEVVSVLHLHGAS